MFVSGAGFVTTASQYRTFAVNCKKTVAGLRMWDLHTWLLVAVFLFGQLAAYFFIWPNRQPSYPPCRQPNSGNEFMA